ncbi:MAG: 50S ribosomal protein L25 [Anaerolineaceae bacterium]|nr:50S ribosomal protein L25 [Anaerolineaceae bacterium]
MSELVIYAEKRDLIGKRVNRLRREGKIPAVIYGSKMEPLPITLNLREASKTLAAATASSLVTIKVGGKDHTVLVREKQKNFIRNELLHVDFQAVSMTEKIRASVSVITQGTSLAVKDMSAVLVNGLTEIEVLAFPQDLPESFVVDISSLTELGSSITVSDLDVPKNVEILSNPDDVIVTATGKTEEVAVDEEDIELDEEGTEPEVIERGKREEDEE